MSAQRRPRPSVRNRWERREPWRSTKYIVCHERRFVYFVVQKVACTSVKAALWPLFGSVEEMGHRADGSVAWGNVHRAFALSGDQLPKPELLKRPDFPELFKFAFVRNPWDRLVSYYHSKVLRSPGEVQLSNRHGRFWPDMPFEEFARAVCQTPEVESDPHFMSQHVTVCEDGQPMADFVGRFESMQEDFRVVADRLGIPPTLPKLHPTKGRREYREMYAPELARMVGERYREDIEVFGYHF
jgi:hypothetical protein